MMSCSGTRASVSDQQIEIEETETDALFIYDRPATRDFSEKKLNPLF